MRVKVTYIDTDALASSRLVRSTFTIQKETGQTFEEFKSELLTRGFVMRTNVHDPDSE